MAEVRSSVVLPMTPRFAALDFGAMSALGTLVSPVLVGRDDLLQLGERRLDQVAGGRGHVLFLAGEAGIGKTRLLGAIRRAAEQRGFVVAAGDLGPRDVEVPGALLFDLTRSMTRTTPLRAAGEAVRARLDGVHEPGRPARARRWLVSDLADLLAATSGPLLLTLENLHWADDLSLEVLASLAARAPEVRVMVVATYRSDELVPGTPMRDWRTRLVTQRLAEEARIPRLTIDQLATMATLLLDTGLPASRDVVEAVHRRTDGIPLYVEELLAMLRRPDGSIDATHRTAVPDTIEYTVRARLEQRSPGARALAEAFAVIGRPSTTDIVAGVLGRDLDAVTEPLQELLDHYVIVGVDGLDMFDFRHVLIGDAVYRLIPEPRRRSLHGRVAELGAGLPGAGDAFASANFEQAGRPDEAFTAALAGARAAAALSAHREADHLYRRSLRTAPAALDDGRRAELLEAAAVEAAAIDDNAAAERGFTDARAAYLRAGRPIEAAAVVAPLIAARHLLGADLAARTGPLKDALTELDAVPPGAGVDRARLKLLAALSAAFMLDRRLDDSIRHGEAAQRLARRLGDRGTELHARITVGADLVFAGRMEEGWATLEAGIDDARTEGREEEAARAWRMAGSCASVLVEYDRAERYLIEGIAHAEGHEQWNHRHYMASHLAHVRWATGHWDDAEELARHALADGRGGITTRITALIVLGYTALGRGDAGEARRVLDEAHALASGMHELQRISPALWGLAELDLLEGNAARTIQRTEEGRALSMAVDDAAYLFPFLVTGVRARLATGDIGGAEAWVSAVSEAIGARGIPGTLPAVEHATGLLLLASGSLGRAQAALNGAVAGWAAAGRAPDRLAASIDAAGCHLRAGRAVAALTGAARALEEATNVGAMPMVERARAIVDAARARHPDMSPWAPLTSREFEVARLVAEGHTNASIGAELGISTRTVGAHVEHIFAKLGVGRRAEIAVWTTSRSIAPSPQTVARD